MSSQYVAEPLSPELALVDPELARLARDRLPVPGNTLEAATSRSPSVALQAPPRLDAATTIREPPRRRQFRVGRRVLLAALAVVLVTAAIYAFAPASTVRDELPTRASKAPPARIGRHASRQAPSNHARRSAGVGAAKVARHSTSATKPNNTKARNTRAKTSKTKGPSTFSTRLFIWPTVPHATFYKVEFFRHGRQVFKTLSSKPRLELPQRWTYDADKYRLVPGTYSWKVSPAFGPRSRLRYGNPIVRSTWVARP